MQGFKKNREGYYVSDTHRQCTNCLEIYKRTSKTVTMCPKCNGSRVKSQSAESKMWRRAKSRAKERGIDFDIEKSDIIIPKCCPILGLTLVCHNKSGAWNDSPSLDRIDPNKGYVKGNVRVISQLANSMKSNASEEHLLMFAQWIIQNQN